MVSSFCFRHFLFFLVFISALFDPGNSLGIRNLILAPALPLLFLYSFHSYYSFLIHRVSFYTIFVLTSLIVYALAFKDNIDLNIALPYWLIILLLPYFTFVFSRLDLNIRLTFYSLSARLFILVSFLLLIFSVLYKPPISALVGPFFIGLTSHSPGVFVYHSSSLYILPLMCLGFMKHGPNKFDIIFIISMLFFFTTALSLGGIVSSLVLLFLIFRKSSLCFVSRNSHHILVAILVLYFLFLFLFASTTDVLIFKQAPQYLTSSQIKIGHFISFISSISPTNLFFGEGPGSPFSSISKDYLVYDIELSPVEAIRKFGLIFYSCFLYVLYNKLKRLSSSLDFISPYLSVSILLLLFNSFWNPLMFGIITVIIISELLIFTSTSIR